PKRRAEQAVARSYNPTQVISIIAPRNGLFRSSLWRRGFLIMGMVLSLGCFVLAPGARAVEPPPDGGYANYNTAEGMNALFTLTFGLENTALGYNALYYTTTGSYNTASGYNALQKNSTASNNTATGSSALSLNTTGTDNTAHGANALYNSSKLKTAPLNETNLLPRH